MTAGLRLDHYDWPGGREAMLRFGPERGPVVIAAMPVFEEANRTRAFLLSILRALAERGIASALPDLPGQGDSLMPTAQMTLQALRQAFAAAVARAGGGRAYSLTVRSGALVDGETPLAGRWRFAPQDGPALLTELRRLQQGKGDPAASHAAIAGNLVSVDFLTALDRSMIDAGAAIRTVRLASDPRPTDHSVAGTPLWRRSEPGNDPDLADRLAADIAEWIARCEG